MILENLPLFSQDSVFVHHHLLFKNDFAAFYKIGRLQKNNILLKNCVSFATILYKV
jgi:hypothetical protein